MMLYFIMIFKEEYGKYCELSNILFDAKYLFLNIIEHFALVISELRALKIPYELDFENKCVSAQVQTSTAANVSLNKIGVCDSADAVLTQKSSHRRANTISLPRYFSIILNND